VIADPSHVQDLAKAVTHEMLAVQHAEVTTAIQRLKHRNPIHAKRCQMQVLDRGADKTLSLESIGDPAVLATGAAGNAVHGGIAT
jgi:hypothetical protein